MSMSTVDVEMPRPAARVSRVSSSRASVQCGAVQCGVVSVRSDVSVVLGLNYVELEVESEPKTSNDDRSRASGGNVRACVVGGEHTKTPSEHGAGSLRP